MGQGVSHLSMRAKGLRTLWNLLYAPVGARSRRAIPTGMGRGFPLAPAPFGIAFLHGGLHVRGSLSEYGIVVRCYLR